MPALLLTNQAHMLLVLHHTCWKCCTSKDTFLVFADKLLASDSFSSDVLCCLGIKTRTVLKAELANVPPITDTSKSYCMIHIAFLKCLIELPGEILSKHFSYS